MKTKMPTLSRQEELRLLDEAISRGKCHRVTHEEVAAALSKPLKFIPYRRAYKAKTPTPTSKPVAPATPSSSISFEGLF